MMIGRFSVLWQGVFAVSFFSSLPISSLRLSQDIEDLEKQGMMDGNHRRIEDRNS
jgi:hypothetical protein